VLRSIVNNEMLEKEIYQEFLPNEQFDRLKKLYHNKKIELDKKEEEYPKYLPFYLIISDKFPNFKWNIKCNIAGKFLIILNMPRVNNLRPSLLSLLLEKVDDDADSTISRKYPCSYDLPKVVIAALSRFMDMTEAIYPAKNEMQKIIDWLLLSLKGEETTIFIPICPDYSVEPLTNSSYRFRHTFDSLGSGIGQIAQRIIEILPALNKMLHELKIQPEIISGIADFEGFSEGTLKRVNLTLEEFLERVNLSRLAFSEKTGLHTLMITEMFGGKEKWIEYVRYIKKAFQQNDFGLTGINADKLLNIAIKRKPLYDRWYGKKGLLERYLPIVLEQGVDYAAMGSLVAQQLKNCLVLGADNNVMAPFYSFVRQVPTLYFKRYYC
jgi:hypothetical protein